MNPMQQRFNPMYDNMAMQPFATGATGDMSAATTTNPPMMGQPSVMRPPVMQQRPLPPRMYPQQQQPGMMVRPPAFHQQQTAPALPPHLPATTPTRPVLPIATPSNSSTTSVPGAAAAQPPAVPPIEPVLAKSETDKKHLTQYRHRDQVYQENLNKQHKRHTALAYEKKRDIETMHARRLLRAQAGPMVTFGQGYSGRGSNPATGLESRILYPRDKKRIRPQAREFRFGLDQLKEQAEKKDVLVPIRLEIEIDGYALRDTFTWNMHETLITPEQFAEVMCEDLQLPPSTFAPYIARGIKDQVHDYYLHSGSMPKEDGEDEKTTNNKQGELRTIIKLDITVGNRALLDQFEWDISCQQNSPEEFAEKMANELGLGGEFRTAIAHSIREQVHVFLKSLLLVGYDFDGAQIMDDDLRHSFLPTLQSTIRDPESVEKFTPAILELTDAEIDKLEKDRMRDVRRKRRQARNRRGVTLPDREPQKTHRTGIAIPPEQDVSDEQFMTNGTAGSGSNIRGSTPTVEPMISQRKSALKARMNIAADAAAENYQSSTPPPQPQSQSTHPYQQQVQRPGLGIQGVIPLNAGNRFSSMVDPHAPRPPMPNFM